MGVKFKNNAESTLAGNINASVTTFDLAVGEGNNFPIVTAGPTDYFYVTLVDVSGNREIVKVTEHQSGDTFQVVERGADDTTGLAFVTGDKVQMRFPKIILEAYRDDIATNAADIATNAADIAAAKLVLYAPSGLNMYFYEDTAPTGWTINAAPADSLLSVKGGSQAYNAAGGQVLGSWTPTGHTHTGPSHTHTGPSHTHTGPSHTHTGPSHRHTGPSHTHVVPNTGWGGASQQLIQGRIQTDNTGNQWHSTNNVSTQSGGTGNTGYGGTGATGASGTGATGASGTALTGASGTDATGSSSEPSTDRPQAAVGIIATKD
jgi:hypothetical protein